MNHAIKSFRTPCLIKVDAYCRLLKKRVVF